MTARLMNGPATTWEIGVQCDRCPRTITIDVLAPTEQSAQIQARSHVRKNDGWSSRTDQTRRDNAIDLCKGCTELQKAGWQ